MKTDLYLGDCLEVMQEMEDGSVDAVITSPPFNLGNSHHTGNIRHTPYSDSLPEADYQAGQLEVLRELYRVVNDGGSLFYQHKNRIREGKQITPYEWLLKSEWTIKQELVWRNRSQNFDKIRFYPQTERIYWMSKSSDTKIFNAIGAHDIFDWPSVGTRGNHTRAFPVEFPAQMLACLPDGITVLDPFMGSGTTGVACVQTGSNFIGIEIEPKYYEIAEKRIAEVKLQIRMEI